MILMVLPLLLLKVWIIYGAAEFILNRYIAESGF